jgi:hypothetical protein
MNDIEILRMMFNLFYEFANIVNTHVKSFITLCFYDFKLYVNCRRIAIELEFYSQPPAE